MSDQPEQRSCHVLNDIGRSFFTILYILVVRYIQTELKAGSQVLLYFPIGEGYT